VQTTLGLALEMAGPAALACSIPLVVQNVTACGTLGLNTARGILDGWKVGRRVVHALQTAVFEDLVIAKFAGIGQS
jgi:hypothetical protein